MHAKCINPSLRGFATPLRMTSSGTYIYAAPVRLTCDRHHRIQFGGWRNIGAKRYPMPILLMALVALAIFLALGLMFFTAMQAEHRKREQTNQAVPEPPKAKAQTAGR